MKGIVFTARIWAIAFFSVGLVYPLLVLLREALVLNQGVSFFDPVVLSVVQATLWQAFWSTFISGFFGFFLGMWVGRWEATNLQSRFQFVLSLPSAVPTVVAALAWTAWFGRSGILNQAGFENTWAYSLKAVIIAHVFFNIPFIALMVSQARSQVSMDAIEAAKSLGASDWRVFQFCIWPEVKWSLASAGAQVMAFCVTSFALVLILGGGPPVETLETLLYGKLRYGDPNISSAAVCAIWELGIVLVPWLAVLFMKRKIRSRPSRNQSKAPSSAGIGRTAEGLGLGLLVISPLLPYLAVFHPSLLGLTSSSSLRDELLRAFFVSIQLAGMTAFLTLSTAVFAILALRHLRSGRMRAIAEVILSIPSGISVLVLGLGVWVAYGSWIDPFEGSFWLISGLQAVLFFPIAYRILWPVGDRINRGALEAAITLGASPFRAFWVVEWQRWKKPALVSFAAVAGGSLGEMGAVSLFYNENLIPLPVLISRWAAKYRFEDAQNASFLLLLMSCALIFSSLEAARRWT